MPHQASRVIADGELDFGPGDEITSRGSIEQGAPRTTKRRSLVETFFDLSTLFVAIGSLHPTLTATKMLSKRQADT